MTITSRQISPGRTSRGDAASSPQRYFRWVDAVEQQRSVLASRLARGGRSLDRSISVFYSTFRGGRPPDEMKARLAHDLYVQAVNQDVDRAVARLRGGPPTPGQSAVVRLGLQRGRDALALVAGERGISAPSIDTTPISDVLN
jgi:hypothetical protein